jgi:hypothetical protein
MIDHTAALVARLRDSGTQDGKDAAGLIEWFLDERVTLLQALNEGNRHVVRKDPDDPLGVIYTHPGLVGHVVQLVYTGKMADDTGVITNES